MIIDFSRIEFLQAETKKAQQPWLDINKSKIKGWQNDVKTFVARRPPIAKLVDQLPDSAVVLELKQLR